MKTLLFIFTTDVPLPFHDYFSLIPGIITFNLQPIQSQHINFLAC